MSLALTPSANEAVAAEQMLLDMAERLVRREQDWRALALHLSRLQPPAPRPHHRIVARALLQDVALRHDGQVFALRNGDLVLLCPAAGLVLPPPRSAPSADPKTLPQTLARLLHVDAPEPGLVLSVWSTVADGKALLAYAGERLGENGSAPAALAEEATPAAAADRHAAAAESGRITDLVQRQTAVLLGAGGAMRPLYREVAFSLAGIAARSQVGGAPDADPFLYRHLAGRLDRLLMEALVARTGGSDPLDAGVPPRLHVNLTLSGILSADFVALARATQGLGLGVEIQLLEAAADPEGFARARDLLGGAGMILVLDGVSHLALQLACPAVLHPDLVKLDWSPLLPGLAAADRAPIEAALVAFGPERVVLHRAESEAALRWGLGQGIRRFQGRHVDAMLAASRMVGCPAAPTLACTLHQCVERAAATGPAGRRPCGNLPLLDAGTPGEMRA